MSPFLMYFLSSLVKGPFLALPKVKIPIMSFLSLNVLASYFQDSNKKKIRKRKHAELPPEENRSECLEISMLLKIARCFG